MAKEKLTNQLTFDTKEIKTSFIPPEKKMKAILPGKILTSTMTALNS